MKLTLKKKQMYPSQQTERAILCVYELPVDTSGTENCNMAPCGDS